MSEPGLEAIVSLRHPEPHQLLGAHAEGDGTRVRAFRPEAEAITLLADDGQSWPMEALGRGLFEVRVPGTLGPYHFQVRYPGGPTFTLGDPYRFWPTLGEQDTYFLNDRPPRAALGEARGASNAPRRNRGHGLRGLGTGGGGRLGGRRLQRLGRPAEPHAPDGHLGGVGALRARGRRGTAVQVRDPAPRRRPTVPQGRPVRLPHRGTAGNRLGGAPARPLPLARPGVARRPGHGADVLHPDGHLRGAPRLVAPRAGGRRPPAHLSRDRRAARRRT